MSRVTCPDMAKDQLRAIIWTSYVHCVRDSKGFKPRLGISTYNPGQVSQFSYLSLALLLVRKKAQVRVNQAITQEAGLNGYSEDRKQKSQTPSFTYEVNCLVEPGADVSLVVVLHRNALVLVVTLKVVRTIGRDVDQGSDAQGVKHVLPGSMIGTAQVQEGQDLHWAPLESKNSPAFIKLVQS